MELIVNSFELLYSKVYCKKGRHNDNSIILKYLFSCCTMLILTSKVAYVTLMVAFQFVSTFHTHCLKKVFFELLNN